MIAGSLLILLGAWLLAVQLVPGLRAWIDVEVTWPLFIVGAGVVLLVIAVLTGIAGLAVPACIVGGIGVVMYWQDATGNWESWSYAWALIPGFVGLGVIVSGLLGGKIRQSVSGGGWLILISLVLFVALGSFFGELNWLGPYWPLFLVGLGLLIMVRGLLPAR